MRTFVQKKLWRDKLIEIMETNHGSRIAWRTLNDLEFDAQLRVKLEEEAQEVRVASSREKLIEELADVFEVIDTVRQLHGISMEDIDSIQTKKRNERGGFIGRKFIETAQHPIGSFGERYCLADPGKYPEIVQE
ncbi:MAG: nucleoside triphosphate pyrophosphohydrolase [Candidatus Babeliales bacterium]